MPMKHMAQSQLSAFLTGSGNKPYRELVQYHIKRQSTKQLQLAVLGETSLLPEVYQPTIMSYIDATNNQLGASGNFWMQTTCRQAFEQIMNIAIEVLPLDGVITSVEDALKTNNHELAFQLFQITTQSFAYSASKRRNQRKFMGIRKGLFG